MFKLFVRLAVPLLMAIVGARKVFKAGKKRKEAKKLESAPESAEQSETGPDSPLDQPAHNELFCMGSVAKQPKRKQRLSRTSWNRGSNNMGSLHGQPRSPGGREVDSNVLDVESSAPVECERGERSKPEPVERPSTKRSRT